MTKGFLYGIIYFLLIPLFALAISKKILGHDLVTIRYFTWEYDSFFVLFLAYVMGLTIFLAMTSRATASPACLDFCDQKGRWLTGPRFELSFRLAVWWVLVVEVLTFALIDHNVHWREREEFSLFPKVLSFYARPVYDLVVVLVVARVASDIVMLLEEFRPGSIHVLLRYIGVIALVIINSGNRWYLALLFAFIFLFAKRRTRLVLVLMFPVLAGLGAILSFIILSHRVAADNFELVALFSADYQIESLVGLLLASIFQITEGGAAGSLLEMLSINSSADPGYFLNKVFLMPLPGMFVEKELPFNIIAGAMIEGTDHAQSINTTILGMFVYSFGLIGLIVVIIFLWVLVVIDSKVRSPIVRLAGFGVAFASFRFGLEYFIVHVIYLYVIKYMFSIRFGSSKQIALC